MLKLQTEQEPDELSDESGLLAQLLREISLSTPSATLDLGNATTFASTASSLPELQPVAAQPSLVLSPGDAPQLRMLSKNTNLQTALIEWPAQRTLSTSRIMPRELRSGSLTQCGDHVDIVAPAENMKQFFKLLHTEGAISLAVHRVGDSLFLEGLEAEPWTRDKKHAAEAAESGGAEGGDGGGGGGGGGGSGTSGGGSDSSSSTGGGSGALQLVHKSLESRFLCYSMGVDGETPAPLAPAAAAAAGELSLGASDASDASGASDVTDDDDDDDDDEREAWMPPRDAPRGFRRVVRWQLDELSLLLGSDTVVFASDAQVEPRRELRRPPAVWMGPS